jgi:hypothetical protein
MKKKNAKIEAKKLLKTESTQSVDDSCSSEENQVDDEEGNDMPKAGANDGLF